MTTRRILITNQYLRLCLQINNILDKKDILINIDNYNFCDILYMFNIYFIDCDENNYKEKIDNLLVIGSIELTNTEKNLIYKPIYEFVLWYKKLN